MSAFFADGRVFDLVLLCLAVEAVLLMLLHRRTGRGLAPIDLLGFLGAGFGLVLAARAAVAGASWPWIAAGLTLALGAHSLDLLRRWSRSNNPRVIQRPGAAV